MIVLPSMRGMAKTQFTPKDISGLLLWNRSDRGLYQTTNTSTPVTSDLDPVGRWEDLSGNNNHWTQGTSATRPTYKTSQLNGLPSILFGGSHTMAGTSLITTSTPTMFIVANKTSGTTYRTMLVIQKTLFLSRANAVDNWGNYLLTDVISGTALGATYRTMCSNITNFNNINLTDNGGTPVNRTNGVAFQSNASQVLGSNISAIQFHIGNIVEVILYNTALSLTDQRRVEAYLRSRYAHY